MLERCVGGKVPFAGTTIDESSGSTGMPYDWIRGSRERMVAHRNIGFFARYAFGTEPLVTINAFSMGAWAAGFNMSLGMMRHGIVKSTGPGPRQDPLDARGGWAPATGSSSRAIRRSSSTSSTRGTRGASPGASTGCTPWSAARA